MLEHIQKIFCIGCLDLFSPHLLQVLFDSFFQVNFKCSHVYIQPLMQEISFERQSLLASQIHVHFLLFTKLQSFSTYTHRHFFNYKQIQNHKTYQVYHYSNFKVDGWSINGIIISNYKFIRCSFIFYSKIQWVKMQLIIFQVITTIKKITTYKSKNTKLF